MRKCRAKHRCQVCLVIAVCIIITFAFLIKVYRQWDVASTPIPVITCRPSSDTDKEVLAAKLRGLTNDILKLKRSLYRSQKHFNALGNQVELISKMLRLLGPDDPITTKTQEICLEKFDSKDLVSNAPYYHLGPSHSVCKGDVPIHSLITILLYVPKQFPKPAMNYVEIMQSIAKYYPEVKVILATFEQLPKKILEAISVLKISFKNEVIKGETGTMWANLLEHVETPYVFLAPYITHFDEDIDLYRLLRMLSYHDEIAVAGGSYRNTTGHWDLGCQQVSFDYWTAWYTAGYYKSFKDCVVCDYTPGPFVARTKLLRRLKFDTSLSEGVFHDLFWRLKHSITFDNVVVVCADVMFNVGTPQISDEALVSFSAKHNIKKMVNSDGTVRWYGCRRGLSYTKNKECDWPDGIGAPPCDLWNLGEAVKFIMQACDEGGFPCEYAAGNVLGAVKFASVLPWEKDADIHFHTKDFEAIRKLQGKFEKAGFDFSAHPSGLGGFSIRTTRWHLAMYGRKSLEVGDMMALGKLPTRVPMSGAWVTVPRNPGLFARNHYVTNYFRHAEHHGGDTFYEAGRFQKCPIPDHSACLDQYPADGNLQFLDYLP